MPGGSAPQITHEAPANEWTTVYSQRSIGLDRFIRIMNLMEPGWDWEVREWPGGYIHVNLGPIKRLLPVPWPTTRRGTADNLEEIFRIGTTTITASIRVRPARSTQFLIRACTNLIYVSDCTPLEPTQ